MKLKVDKLKTASTLHILMALYDYDKKIFPLIFAYMGATSEQVDRCILDARKLNKTSEQLL